MSSDLVVANNMPSLSLEAQELITKHYIEQILSPQEGRDFLELELQKFKPREVSAPKDENELTIAARSTANDTKELTRQLTTCTNTGIIFLFMCFFFALTIHFIIPVFSMNDYEARITHIQSRETFVCFFCLFFGSVCIPFIFITFWYDTIAISLRFRSGNLSREEKTHGSFIGIPIISIFTGKFRFSLEYAPVVKLFLFLFSLCLFVGVMGIYFRVDQAGVASANAFSHVAVEGWEAAIDFVSNTKNFLGNGVLGGWATISNWWATPLGHYSYWGYGSTPTPPVACLPQPCSPHECTCLN
jgi:hypothetical protein